MLLNNTIYNNIKYVVINLTTDVKDLYTENYEAYLREIKENLKKYTTSWVKRLNIAKKLTFPKLLYTFNTI